MRTPRVITLTLALPREVAVQILVTPVSRRRRFLVWLVSDKFSSELKISLVVRGLLDVRPFLWSGDSRLTRKWEINGLMADLNRKNEFGIQIFFFSPL